MKDIKTISPFFLTVIVLFVVGLAFMVPLEGLLLKCSLSDFHAEYINLLAKMSVLMLLGFSLIKKWNLAVLAGLSASYNWKHKYLTAIPVYIILLGLASVIATDLTKIELPNLILLLLSCLAVGFAEELLFRGVLQSFYLKKYVNRKSGMFLGIFIPSLAFGLFHLINYLKYGALLPVLVQVVFATFIGFFFGVVLLKTNKLIPIAITHALINFSFSLQNLPNLQSQVTQEPENASVAPIVIFLPLLIIALLLLKKIDKTDVQEKLSQSF
ncbi:MAG: CPBP family intramembrane glutamic endopeptidase [Imperialibacter sp.]|uniref:CPBP family intramembrane glutamic endopeptidase n=1 Tax=Imperialibacter sp. TaxID=2038411 RepID=UPI0032EC0196